MEAVVAQGDGGAALWVYIVPKGGSTRNEHEVLLVDCVSGFKATWADVKMLELRFNRARIYHFTNYWYSREVQDFRYKLEIVLVHPPGPVLGC